ncbi:hypothetical protein NPS01_35380 [Nocardioides psychrotolerans]|uniref:Uncharacterized protein n=1 Tax=Nocardioides psychrotolerans TaxID=1005945 RepID=A0A1I3PW90_9ACTN|nr:hypothetical protein [Nocardioides psychrotolerans]GEP39875.1 hypothetical protein NPS01_35380 [Nocardioides psychrotolerans]SFJ25710.1 hypothetical protein SAMN05216561_12233 [Nocardioides psychrotolerans]
MVAILVLGVFLLIVLALTLASRRHGPARQSCCAPSDPADDLRMRPAFESDPPADD